MDIARNELGAKGILLHLNNLSTEQSDRAAVMLRDIRDPALMIDGYHWLVVGTNDAVRTIVDGVPQLRSMFQKPPALTPPLQRRSPRDLQGPGCRDLEAARYRYKWGECAVVFRRHGAIPDGLDA